MSKKIVFVILTVVFGLAITGIGLAQEIEEAIETEVQPEPATETPPQTEQAIEPEKVIKGTIEEIAEDGSFVIVNGIKVLTAKYPLEDYYLTVGDQVEIMVEDTPEGMQAKGFRYVFEEEPQPSYQEESLPDEEIPAEGSPIEDYNVEPPFQEN